MSDMQGLRIRHHQRTGVLDIIRKRFHTQWSNIIWFVEEELKGIARIVPSLQLYNSIHYFCAHRIYLLHGDSTLRDTKVECTMPCNTSNNGLTIFIFFENFRAGCERSRQLSDRMRPIFVIFSAHSCSTHQPLEVIFVGCDWKCLYDMYCIKKFLWICCCMLKSIKLLV